MKTKEEILNGYKPMLREWHHLIKDRNATEEDFVNDLIHRLDLIITQTREETLKEIIREYQDNELDGKGYDFYFSIRAKIDELNKLKK